MTNTENWLATIDEIDALLPFCARTLDHFFDDENGFVGINLRNEPVQNTVSSVSHAVGFELSRRLPAMNCNYEKKKNLFELLKEDEHWDEWKKDMFNMDTVKLRALDDRPLMHTAYRASTTIAPFLECYFQLLNNEAVSMSSEQDLSAAEEWVSNWEPNIEFTLRVLDAAVNKIKESGTPNGTRPTGTNHSMMQYRMRRCIHAFWMLKKKGKEFAQQDEARNLDDMRKQLDKVMLSRTYYSMSMCAAVNHNEDDALQLGFLLYSLRQYRRSMLQSDVLVEYALEQVAHSLFGAENVPKLEQISDSENISASPIGVLSLLAELSVCRQQFFRLAPLYERAYSWIMNTKRELAGPDTPFWMAEPWRGEKHPELWINAGTIEFLINYRELLRDAISKSWSSSLGARFQKPLFSSIREHEVKGGLSKHVNIATALQQKIVFPVTKVKGKVLDAGKAVLLFGPSGCGKTELARSIAWELKWPMIEIGADILTVSEADSVLSALTRTLRCVRELDRKVVVLDEPEKALKMANHQDLEYLIKSHLLTGIERIKEARRIVLIVATSNVKPYMKALRRPARFDFVIPVHAPEVDHYDPILGHWGSQAGEDSLPWKHDFLKTLIDFVRSSGWKPTLGEIFAVAGQIADKCRGDSTKIEDMTRKVAGHISDSPMIDSNEYVDFEKTFPHLIYPPTFD